MKKNILLLSGVIVVLSILHVSDTKLRLWDSPEISSQYIGSEIDIQIETDRDFFIFDLFINFFSNIDFNSQTVEASLEEKEVDIKNSFSDISTLLAEKEDDKEEVVEDVVVEEVVEEVKGIQVVSTPDPSINKKSVKEEVVQKEEPKKEIDLNKVFLAVKEMPKFDGGDEALQKYIQNNTNYPDVARKMGLQGYVYISYVVNQVGDVVDVNLKKGVHPVLDDEALRVVASIPKYKSPGKKDGIPVKVQLTLPVNFVYQSGNPVFDAWWDALSLEEKQVFGEEETTSEESSLTTEEAVVSEENTTSESLLDNTQESFVAESTENQSTSSSNIEEQISMIKKFPAKGATIALMIRYLKSGELTFDDLCSIRDSREGKSIKRKHLKKMIKKKKKESK